MARPVSGILPRSARSTSPASSRSSSSIFSVRIPRRRRSPIRPIRARPSTRCATAKPPRPSSSIPPKWTRYTPSPMPATSCRPNRPTSCPRCRADWCCGQSPSGARDAARFLTLAFVVKRTRVAPLFALATVVLLVQSCTDAPRGSRATAPFETVVGATPDEVLVGAGNIATCGGDDDEATAQLLDAIPGTVVTLGDNAFPHGTLADYTNCYDPTWGRHKARTQAVLGNHEYDAGNADGAFAYFGDRAGPNGLGYYSFDLGAWHVIVLNDNIPFGPGSAQDQWLVGDLAAHTGRCTLAMWHVPLFLSSNFDGYTVNDDRKPLWDRLYAAHVDLVLNGHVHHYERFAPMRPDGTRDDAAGIREINVGTGGESMDEVTTVAIHPNSEVRGFTFGVLKVTLEDGGYTWQFVPVAGETFTDSGHGACHEAAGENHAPTANPGGPYRSEDVVSFDGTGSYDPDGDGLTYAWDFGDGTTATGAAPPRRPASTRGTRRSAPRAPTTRGGRTTSTGGMGSRAMARPRANRTRSRRGTSMCCRAPMACGSPSRTRTAGRARTSSPSR